MEKKILRLLIVDDSPDDAEIAVAELRKGGYMVKSQCVQDITALEAAVDKGDWDIVVSEYQLPQFGAVRVLDLLKQAKLDIPLIVLVRAIRDAEMVKIMQTGARDVILKTQSARLLPAAERELISATERAEYRHAKQALEEMEHKHRAVIEGAREAICYSQDGMHINANKAYLDMFEYESVSELEGVPLMDLIDKNDRARFKECMRKSGAPTATQEFLAIRKGGSRFHVEMAMSPIAIDGETCTQVLVIDVSKRRAVENKLRYLNEHDALTGLYNRHYFLQELTRAVDRAKRDNVAAGVVYIDLQDLRRVNNTFGHAVADRFLIAAARVLRETFDERAILTRFGDHEFSALVHDTPASELGKLGERVEKSILATSFEENGAAVKCTCRLSHTVVDAKVESAQKLMSALCGELKRPEAATPAPVATPPTPPASTIEVTSEFPITASADIPALTATPPPKNPKPVAKPVAKPAAKASPRTGSPSMPSAAPTAKPQLAPAAEDWSARLQAAVEKEAFELNYQPMVNLHGDPAEYFEVLVRLIGENDERIPPGQFMAQAEKSKQSSAIDRWVVRHAIRTLADLRQQGRKVTFFINLSATALHDVEMVVMLQRWLNESGIRGKYVVLELEESTMAANAVAAVAFLRAAKKVGCRVCIDNFGPASAAIAKLDGLPVDYAKIDGALIKNSANAAGQAVLKETVESAKQVSKHVIAKSVESAEILSVLWTLGLDYAQGHYFQPADASTDYAFAAETELSSDSDAPQWSTRR